MLSCTGVLVVGVTSVARGSKGESERERDPAVNVSVSPRAPAPASTFPCVAPCLRKALGILFYRYKGMPICTMGCSWC
jgi:hypothetical protein